MKGANINICTNLPINQKNGVGHHTRNQRVHSCIQILSLYSVGQAYEIWVPKQFHQLFVVIAITFTVHSEHYGDIQQPANQVCQYLSSYPSCMILQLKSVNTYSLCAQKVELFSVTSECSTCYCITVE